MAVIKAMKMAQVRNEEAICGNCPYWKRKERNECDIEDEFVDTTHGHCRRYAPPRVINMPDSVEPISLESHWCGEQPDFWKDEEPVYVKCCICGEDIVNKDGVVAKGGFRHVGCVSITRVKEV